MIPAACDATRGLCKAVAVSCVPSGRTAAFSSARGGRGATDQVPEGGVRSGVAAGAAAVSRPSALASVPSQPSVKKPMGARENFGTAAAVQHNVHGPRTPKHSIACPLRCASEISERSPRSRWRETRAARCDGHGTPNFECVYRDWLAHRVYDLASPERNVVVDNKCDYKRK